MAHSTRLPHGGKRQERASIGCAAVAAWLSFYFLRRVVGGIWPPRTPTRAERQQGSGSECLPPLHTDGSQPRCVNLQLEVPEAQANPHVQLYLRSQDAVKAAASVERWLRERSGPHTFLIPRVKAALEPSQKPNWIKLPLMFSSSRILPVKLGPLSYRRSCFTRYSVSPDYVRTTSSSMYRCTEANTLGRRERGDPYEQYQ